MKCKTLFWFVVTTSVVLLTACATPQTPQTTPLPSATLALSTQTQESSATLTPTTANPTHTPYPTRRPTITTGPTHVWAQPTLKPTQTRLPSLTTREPTIKQLESFLGIQFGYTPDGKTIDAEFFYVDVTGDSEADLVVHNAPFVFILNWVNDEYLQIYSDSGGTDRSVFHTQTLLEDWTGDGIPEILFDNRNLGGGTEHDIYDVRRKMIHCQDATCTVVWDDTVAFQDIFYGFGASITNEKLEMTPIILNSQPAMQVVSSAFFLDDNASGFSSETEPGRVTLWTRSSIRQTYLWNGTTFELTEEQEISSPQKTDNLAVLTATNAKGQLASIVPTDPDLPYTHDICQLIVENNPVSTEFPCAGNFSQVFWQDVTGDGKEEAIVTLLFGYIYQYGDALDDALRGGCPYQQRQVIYQAQEDTYREIANVVGCVAGEDLYGTRLEDTNADGLPEILASSDEWNTSNLVYQWDGTSFVLIEEVCLNSFPGYTYKCRTNTP